MTTLHCIPSLFIHRIYLLGGIVQPPLLWKVALFFSLVICSVIVYILIYRLRIAKRAAGRNMLINQYSELISRIAISDTEKEMEEIVEDAEMKSKLERWLGDSYSRYILIKELVTVVKNMSGAARENICWFYNRAGLDKDSLHSLKSSEWHIQAKAIQVLAQLNQKQHIARIYRFTNDKNELVRNEARIAVVKLTGFEGLRFLDVISYPLTEWQQLCLLHELAGQNEISFEDVRKWLQSANTSVIEFALRLTEVYKIHELHDDVIGCLHHPLPVIRKRALPALHEIYSADTASLLVNRFEQEDADMQLSILRLLQQVGTENEIPFLSKKLLDRRNDFKVAAARAIRTIKADGLKLIEQAINKNMQPWPVLLPQLQQEAHP